MKIRSFVSRAARAGAVAVISFAVAGVTSSALAQGGREGGRSGQPNLSPEEQNLVKAIMAAPDPAAKLKAAATLIEKHPKTSIRSRLAANLSEQIAGVTDASQKLTLAQDYQKIFKEQSEQDLFAPVLIDAYAGAGQTDEAFSNGANFLARQPESVSVLVRLTFTGTDLAKKRNNKFVEPSLKYGVKAIELIEANKKPADLNDNGWNYYKGLLPNLYNAVGILNLTKSNRADAKAAFIKATQLAPTDPFNYLMLTGVLEDEYNSEAKQYKAMPAGPARDAALQKTLGLMDAMIDACAHMIALSEGNATLRDLRQQYLQDIEAYYKYRHNNSAEGLQKLIDKYKVAAK